MKFSQRVSQIAFRFFPSKLTAALTRGEFSSVVTRSFSRCFQNHFTRWTVHHPVLPKARTRKFLALAESLEMRVMLTESPAEFAFESQTDSATVVIPPEFQTLDLSFLEDDGGVSPFISDGRLAPFRPEVVSIVTPIPGTNKTGFGTGTFITRRDVLTAAHVIDTNQDFRYNPATDGVPTIRASQNADVRIGTTVYRVASVTIAPGYRQVFINGEFYSTENDLAILHLETYEEIATPVALNRNAPARDQLIEVLGYGRIASVSTGIVQNNTDIRKVGIAQIDTVQSKLISWTLDQQGESATLPGDSGGPSFVWDASGKRYLAGVTSFGTTTFGIGSDSTVTRVDAFKTWIDQTIQNLNSGTAASAQVVSKHDITTPSQAGADSIRLSFTSAVGIHLVAGRSAIALIGPNGYYNPSPRVGLVITSADNTRITIDYYFDGPGGTWTAADNGTYTVALVEGGIVNAFGTSLAAGAITTLNVNIPPDNTPPTAASGNRTITVPGRPNLIATVTYSDPTGGIDGSTLGNDDVQLVRNDGTVVSNGRLMIPGLIRNNTTYRAMYEFTAPGGAWDPTDNGTYRIVVRGGAVRDTSRNPIASSTLATVTVNIPAGTQIAPWGILNASNITTSTTTQTFTITYFDDRGLNLSSIQTDNSSGFYDVNVFSSGLQWNSDARFVSLQQNSNGSVTAIYRWVVPSAWTATENGTRFDVTVTGITDTDGNPIQGGNIGAFQVNIAGGGAPDATRPQAFANALPLTNRGLQSYVFDALFTDDVALNPTTITSDSLIVIAPNGQELSPNITGINYGGNAPMTAVSLSLAAPGGEWDPSDNGLYRIVVRDGTIADTSGNFVEGYSSGTISQSGELVTFEVLVSNNAKPAEVEATLTVSDVLTPREAHEFQIRYTCLDGIDTTTLGNTDVYVTGPNGFAQFATLVGFTLDPDSKAVVARYQIVGPGGSWSPDDNDTYTISTASGAVLGMTKNAVAPFDLGVFRSLVAENQAPVLNPGGAPALTPILEDDRSNSGTSIATLIAGLITDNDAGAMQGVAITQINTNQATFQYSLDGGTQWTALGSVSADSARLLAADSQTRIRALPEQDFNGTISNAFQFRAWDRTIGSNGGLANTTINGGTSAFSTTMLGTTLIVQSVNDLPVFTSTTSLTVVENNVQVGQFAATDVDLPAQSLTFAIQGGADSTQFSLTSAGALSFNTAPDFENPRDLDNNNVYNLIVAVSDGAGGTITQNLTITVLNTNEPPAVDLNGPSAGINFSTSFIVGGSAVTIVDTANLTIADPDSSNLTQARVILSNLPDGVDEFLDVTIPVGSNIQKSYLNGTLLLSGTDTLSHYEQVLRTLTYKNNSSNPTTTTRTVTASVTDETLTSETAVATVSIESGIAVLDIDGNRSLAANTDGKLLLLYLGRAGNTQLSPFIAAGGRTVEQVRTYLDGLKANSTLDIDGNGTIAPATDGKLLLLYLGRAGNLQLSSFIAPGGRTVEQVRAYLDQLTGKSARTASVPPAEIPASLNPTVADQADLTNALMTDALTTDFLTLETSNTSFNESVSGTEINLAVEQGSKGTTIDADSSTEFKSLDSRAESNELKRFLKSEQRHEAGKTRPHRILNTRLPKHRKGDRP